MASMFKSPPKPPKPALLPDEKSLAEARKKQVAAQRLRSGRSSTMLSMGNGLGN